MNSDLKGLGLYGFAEKQGPYQGTASAVPQAAHSMAPLGAGVCFLKFLKGAAERSVETTVWAFFERRKKLALTS
jgi:hypothetical protein